MSDPMIVKQNFGHMIARKKKKDCKGFIIVKMSYYKQLGTAQCMKCYVHVCSWWFRAIRICGCNDVSNTMIVVDFVLDHAYTFPFLVCAHVVLRPVLVFF